MSEDNLYEEPVEVLFRPSYSATFLNCEAALLDGRFYPDSAGIEAAIGTVFHDVMNEWLVTNTPPRYRHGHIAEVWKQDADRTKDKPFLVEIDEDMFYYGQQCMDYAKKFKGKRYVERRVDISHLTPIPKQSGTLDVGFVRPGWAATIDWKYGTGVKVFASWNTQQLLYLSGLFEEFDFIYDFQEFEIHVAQPRLGHWDKFTLNRAQLLEWMEWSKVRMKAAWQRKNRTYTVGTKQCTWCKRRDDCRAKLVHLEKLVDEDFDRFAEPITTKEAKEVTVFKPPPMMETTILRLSPQELAQLYEYRKLFESWFRKIGERLLELGIDGAEIGDYYVAEGRSFRKWKSERRLVEKLKLLGIHENEMYDLSLKSPNQMEKVIRDHGMRGQAGKDYLKLFYSLPPGKPTLVKKGEDDRPSIDTYEDVFDVEK